MKIEKIFENDDKNKNLTSISAYTILSLINKRLNNNIKVNDKIIIEEFFDGFDFDINPDNYIKIADEFIKNNFDKYDQNIENTQEIPIIK